MISRGLNDRSWCIAKENANPNSLQTAIDWVCGSECIDCGPIQLGNDCYDPNNVFFACFLCI